jgi:hypothetical protein
MNKNNVIRFAQALVLLPIMAGTLSFGNVPEAKIPEKSQTVFTQKPNIALSALFAFNNQVKEEEKLKTLKLQGDAIDAYFSKRDAPLAGLGLKMAQEADINGLDWRLLPAIALRESNAGIDDCDRVEHSFFGWGSCRIPFNSDEQAIEVVAMNLGGNNPATEKYYQKGSTTEQILRRYNSYIKNYPAQVMRIMDSIGSADLKVAEEKVSV